jgi:hypothetical protein
LRTNLTAVAATASPTATRRPSPRSTSGSNATPGQVSTVPGGGVAAGGGSTTDVHEGRLLVVGGALLLAASGGVLLRRRSALGTGPDSR